MISVIIPMYNVEKYISKTIESVLENDFSDYEIILIDDGSIDNTYSICKEYSQKDKRIKLYKQDNKGVSNARNRGIRLAKGDYISFIDADDTISNNYFSTLYNIINDNNLDFVMCAIKTSDNKLLKPFEHDLFICRDNILETLNKTIKYTYPVARLYKKDIILDNKILFNESISYGEDALFNYSLFHHLNSFGYINKTLYYYNIHQDSLTNLSKNDYLDNMMHLINELEAIRISYNDDIFDEELQYYFMQMLTILSKRVFRIEDRNLRRDEYNKLDEAIDNNPLVNNLYHKLKPNIFNNYNSVLVHLFLNKKYDILYHLWHIKNHILS